jgi:SAM-dependent methyltransferase
MTERMDLPQNDPIQYWNGPAAQRWVHLQEKLDRMLAPFNEALLAKARPVAGERAVDVGCGCGTTTLALAAAVGPGGSVVGLDVSAPMLACARQRARDLGTVTFLQADATTHAVHPPVDLVVSRFGVMFFSDPPAAFANLWCLIRPGGRLVFVCWRALSENPWACLPYEATREALSAPALSLDAAGPGPFSLADSARIHELLAGAGFTEITIDPADTKVVLGEKIDDASEFAIEGGPAARLLVGADEAVRARAVSAVHRALAPYVAGGRVTLPAAAWLVSARCEASG